jgi:hypothetical protein
LRELKFERSQPFATDCKSLEEDSLSLEDGYLSSEEGSKKESGRGKRLYYMAHWGMVKKGIQRDLQRGDSMRGHRPLSRVRYERKGRLSPCGEKVPFLGRVRGQEERRRCDMT